MISKGKKTQSGFGLVEVLVSITIIGFVIVAFNQLAIYAYYNWEDARNKSVAYNLIQSTMEDMRNRRDVNVNLAGAKWSDAPFLLEGNTSLANVTIGGDIYTTTVNVLTIPVSLPNQPPLNGLLKKKVTVTVGWTERLGPRTMQAVTYFTDWKGKY